MNPGMTRAGLRPDCSILSNSGLRPGKRVGVTNSTKMFSPDIANAAPQMHISGVEHFLRKSIIKRTDRLLGALRSEEHTSELQSHLNLVCRLLLEKKKQKDTTTKHASSL